MERKIKTYTAEFKYEVVRMYLEGTDGYKTVGSKMGIHGSLVSRWAKAYQLEGMQGLEEKRGKSFRSKANLIQNEPRNQEEKIRRLEAENAYLKKLLEVRKEGISQEKEQ